MTVPATAPAPRTTGGFAPSVLGMYAALGLIRAMDVATGIMTARLLGPHDRGLYSLLVMIPHTLESLVKLGIAPANIYMICRRRVPSAHIVSNSLFLAVGLGGVALLILPFRDIIGEKLLANVDGWYVALAVSLVPFYLLSTYMTSVLYALNRFQIVNLRTTLSAGLRLVGTAVVLLLLQKGLFEAFLVNVIMASVTGVWLLPIVWKLTSASLRPNIGVAAATVRFGLKSHLQSLLTVLHLRLDHFLVALFLSPSEVAFYAIATHIAELISGIHRPVSIVLYPRLASASETRAHDTTITVCRHVLLLETLAAAAIILGSRFAIVTLYGRDYLPAVKPLLILLPGVVMLSLFNLLARNFMSRNKQQVTIVAGFVGLATNIGLNLVMIPRLGIHGAALASTVSYSLATLILLVVFRQHAGTSLIGLIKVQRTDLAFYAKLIARFATRPVTA